MSSHETYDRGAEFRPSSNRTFGLVFVAFFLLVALYPLTRGGAARIWALAAAALFLLAAVLAPAVLTPLNRAWTAVGSLLHKVTNPIILGLLFFGIFTPLGWLLRRMGKDPLRLRRTEGGGSYWLERRPAGPSPASIANQY